MDEVFKIDRPGEGDPVVENPVRSEFWPCPSGPAARGGGSCPLSAWPAPPELSPPPVSREERALLQALQGRREQDLPGVRLPPVWGQAGPRQAAHVR